MRRHFRAEVAALAIAGALACTTARLATPSGEAKVGADAAAEVEKQIGLVHAPELESYLTAIGTRLTADPSVRTGITYQFRIVDMPEPNAFALPGGFIYVSRGLLPLLNSEDELASVLAHEIGHVSAQHHLHQALVETPLIPVRIATGIGSLATGIVSEPLGELVGAIGEAPGSLAIASYSRGQEDEADEIGQKLAADTGWDPRAMAAVMDALSRAEQIEGRDPNQRSYFDTHPTTPDRSRLTLERAATLKVAKRAPIARDVRHFYEKLDGLLSGDPASNGVVVDNEFLHSELDIRVAFPEEWQIENGANSVVAAPKQRDAVAVFSIAAEGDDPVAIAKKVIRKASLQVEGAVEATKIAGLPAARVEAKSSAGWLSYNHHVVCWIAHRGKVYQLSGTAAEENWPRYRAPLSKAVESFRTLAANDRKRIREARVRVVDARSGETVASLVKRVDSAWSPKRTAAANDIPSEEDVLHSGQPVKVARWEAYTGSSD